MESKTNYTLVGILVLIFSSATIIAAFWLSMGLKQKVYITYAIYMNEPVNGLSVQAPVKFNGVAVGFVSDIALNKVNPQQVLLLIDVEQGAPITTSTTAVLQSQGITGIRYVELKAGSRFSEPLKKMTGETFPVIPSRPSLLVQLDSILKDATENFQQIADSVNSVLDKENAEAIRKTFKHVERISAALANQTGELSASIKDASVVFKNAAIASKTLPAAVERISESGDAMKKMATDVSYAGRMVASTMKSSKAAVDQIKDQTLPQATGFMDRLDQVAQNMAALTKELKRNPAMLIRGKRPRPLGPGER